MRAGQIKASNPGNNILLNYGLSSSKIRFCMKRETTTQQHSNLATAIEQTILLNKWRMIQIMICFILCFARWFPYHWLRRTIVRMGTVRRVNSRASSVPQWQTHVSHTLSCFPDTAELPGCWQGCLGSAHPVKTVTSERHVNNPHIFFFFFQNSKKKSFKKISC